MDKENVKYMQRSIILPANEGMLLFPTTNAIGPIDIMFSEISQIQKDTA